MVISGNTRLIAHLGYPTASFKAPMIYNPWFVDQQVDVKVVPMGVRPEDYAAFIPPLFTMTNIIGALVTMPHKIATCDLVQRLSPTAAIAGACNAIRREADGSLSGDMFDGEGFVLGLRRKGFNPQGTRPLPPTRARVPCGINPFGRGPITNPSPRTLSPLRHRSASGRLEFQRQGMAADGLRHCQRFRVGILFGIATSAPNELYIET
ncbi:hypothetical protein QNH95_20610, partial [Klebsiella pneumoniae]|uniref:shikimate dehydrogenase family protein n=1 Tax=Klebsiella pneumoniae TaxID=573 RepID=UPI002A1B3A5E|nr:hypothetical protein [Klebsiella pneumoniae]